MRRSASEIVAEHELDRWAERLGVEERLRDPATAIAPVLERDNKLNDTMTQLATGDVRRAALGRLGRTRAMSESIAQAARKYLEVCAAELERSSRRAAILAIRPTHPVMIALAQRFAEMEEELPVRRGGRPLRVDFDARAIAFEVSDGPREARLILANHARGELTFDPPEAAASELGGVLVREARDVVHDTRHRLHAALFGAVAEPAWQRQLDAVRSAVAELAENSSRERLVYRVALVSGVLTVEPVQQKPLARGGWSRGSKVRPEDALSSAGLTGAERHALRALISERNSGPAEALDALVGHDVEAIDEKGATLTLLRAEAAFAFIEEPGGFRAALAIGAVRIPLEDVKYLPRKAFTHAVIDEASSRVLVAHVPAVLAELLVQTKNTPAIIPAAEHGTLVPVIEQVAARVPVALPSALEAEIAVLPTRLIVRIVPEDKHTQVEIRARVSKRMSFLAGEGNALVSVLGAVGPDAANGVAVLRRRDLEGEVREAREIARVLAFPEGRVARRVDSGEGLFAVLEALHGRPDIDVEWPERSERARFVGTARRVTLSVFGAAHWFGVEGTAEIDGETISLAELLAAVREGRRFVRLSEGRFALIENELRDRLMRASDVIFETPEGQLAIAATAGDALEALAADEDLRVDEAWSTIRARLKLGRFEEPSVPDTLAEVLRGYQRDGFAWMARLASVGAGAVLADDMGLGKTVQALALMVHRASLGPTLVIAPTSLGDNWMREAARFAPGLRMQLHHGSQRHQALSARPLGPGDVLVTTYDLVTLDLPVLAAVEFSTLVLDEAQAIKNPDAQRTKAVKNISADFRVALTGTPLQNRLSDLFSIFAVVHPGLLGSWRHFRDRFAIPIEQGGDNERSAALATLVRPYLLRRTKEVVMPELPPRIEVTREIELHPTERKLYDAERADALMTLGGAGEGERFQILASITRLRQLACDPALVTGEDTAPSSKVEALLEIVEELASAGRKVLVFSQFVRLLERVEKQLASRGISYFRLDGQTPAPERARLVERFQGGQATVFLLSLKAGGVGLNLTAADHVIHLDPWWNPAAEDQASDRAHRIGQDKPVTIIRLVAKHTIEQSVLALHAQKRELTRGVLEGTDAAGGMSAGDLVALIRGGAMRE